MPVALTDTLLRLADRGLFRPRFRKALPIVHYRRAPRGREEPGVTDGESARVAGRHGHARVAVLTIIDEEFNAVREVFGATDEIGTTGIYAPARADLADGGVAGQFPFVLAQSPERSNIPASEATRQLSAAFRPEIFVVVGIAGGVRRANMSGGGVVWSGASTGDVVIASYVHYGEYAKHLPGGTRRRYFQIDHPAAGLVQMHGKAPERDLSGPPWHAAIRAPRPAAGAPAVTVGEILAVEAVAAAPDRDAQAAMLAAYDNAVAVDMESMGVGRAMHEIRASVHYNPRWMCVRGISDPVLVYPEDPDDRKAAILEAGAASDNDAQRKAWKPYAAEAAAVYARLIVERILRTSRPAVPADDGAPQWAFPPRPENVGA